MMHRTLKRDLGVLSAVFLGCAAPIGYAESPQKIEIDVKATAHIGPTGSPILRFTVTNKTKDTVQIFKANLPWGVRTSLTLVILPTGADASPLDPAHYVDDPGPEVVSLKAKSEASGAVDLANRYPDLPQVLKTHDVIALWSYEAQFVDGARSPRSFGGALIRRHK